MRFFLYYFFVLSVIYMILGCKKFVEIDPPKTRLVTSSVFTSDAGANAAISGIYSKMMDATNGIMNGGVTLYAGLSADEFDDFSSGSQQTEFYKNSLTASNGLNQRIWQEGYKLIYAANAIIYGVINGNGVTAATSAQVTAEAKFIRAYCHLMLVNLYGDIPLVLSTDYGENSAIARTPAAQVYEAIIMDLKDAQTNLPGDFSLSGGEKIRPNKWAATALLARMYFYKSDWTNAEAQSSTLITNPLFGLEANLNNVFLKNSKEAIWQLMPVKSGVNTYEGQIFILIARPDNVALTSQLVQSFQTGDTRKQKWMDSIFIGGKTYYYPFKYKIKTSSTITEYYSVLRLAEQYLLRAEARCQLGNIAGAVADLNIIRTRASLTDLNVSLTKLQCMAAIGQERRSELFCEWGHRWLDLKRRGEVDAVLGPLKTPNWIPSDALYPIPSIQLLNDQNITQNPGY